jgi:tetratricopeptide (TPR) repeat protein/DNA-binding MarR family transcriptional regulator
MRYIRWIVYGIRESVRGYIYNQSQVVLYKKDTTLIIKRFNYFMPHITSCMKNFEKINLTYEEKILLHLLNYIKSQNSFDIPLEVTQEGIANAVGMKRSNVPRTVQQLLKRKYVVEDKCHVIGCKMRRKAYFLTQNGMVEAKRINDKMGSVRIYGETPDAMVKKDGIISKAQYKAEPSLYPELLGVQTGKIIEYTENAPSVRRFFGREHELKAIVDRIEKNDGKLIIISGIAGVGKSTFAARLLDIFRGKRGLFWMKLHEWITLRNLLTELGEFLSRAGRNRLKMYLGSKQSIDLWEISAILRNDIPGIPTILIIDDVHKASDELKPFFSIALDLTESISGFALVFVGREVLKFYDARHTELMKSVMELRLEGLDRKSSDRLLASRGLDESEFQGIYSYTRGHPLALELIQSHDDFKMRTKGIYKFIRNEIFLGLGESGRQILNAASVHRYPVGLSALFTEDVNETDRSQTNIEVVNNLLDRGFVIQASSDTYDIHDLIREYVYADLTFPELKRFHIRAAKYYEVRSSPDQTTKEALTMEAMYHYLKAKEYEKVAEIAVRFNRSMLNAGLTEQLKNILEELNGDDVKGKWNEILLLKGGVYDKMGMWDKAIMCYEECEKFIKSASKRPWVGVLYEAMGHTYSNASRWKEAIEYFEKSAKIMKEQGNQEGIALAESGIGHVLFMTGRYKEALKHQRNVMNMTGRICDKKIVANALIDIGNILIELGEFGHALKEFQRGIIEARDSGLMYELARGHLNSGNAYFYIGEFNLAIDNFREGERILSKMGFICYLGRVFSAMGAAYSMKDELEKAENYLTRGLEILQQIKDDYGLAICYSHLGDVYKDKHEYKIAEKNYKKAIEIMRKLNVPKSLAGLYLDIGLFYKDTKDPKNARLYMEKSYGMFERLGAKKHYLIRRYSTLKKRSTQPATNS